jgi:hypothetical protein
MLGRKEIQLLGRIDHKNLDHDTGQATERWAMVGGSYSLIDSSIVLLGFRNMLLRIGIVHLDSKIICKRVHERAELIVTLSISNLESPQVVNSKDLTQAIL